MKQSRTKYGDNAAVINALSAIGAWPVASTVQIYEVARQNGFGYVGAAEVFMTHKVGRGKWDLSNIGSAPVVSSKPKKAGKPVLSSVTPVLKKAKAKKSKEQSWPANTRIIQDEGEPDTIVVDTVTNKIVDSAE